MEGDKINILHIIELIAFCYHPVTWEAKLREEEREGILFQVGIERNKSNNDHSFFSFWQLVKLSNIIRVDDCISAKVRLDLLTFAS